jgi:alpha-beta hydrolase superfamily lysophospholipase/glutathione S-transferase
MQSPYTLYGAQISYFSGKVRALLRFKGIPFEEVAADARVYREVIVPGVGFPVIPVLRTPTGVLLQDSTEIIEALERAHPEPATEPPGPVQHFVARLLELYADEWLVIPAMHYRWHHNREWAMRAFGELSAPRASREEQFEIGQRRAAPFAQAAVLLGAEPHMHAPIERSYEALLRELDAHFAQHACVLGGRPSIADFALYGPLYAHQYRDPASGELMRRIAPHVVAWIERLKDGTLPPGGEFMPGDAVPPTLLPVLRRMLRDQLPVLQASVQRLREWMVQHPGEARVPRTLGMHVFELEGVQGQRIVRPYGLWMLQRARELWHALPETSRPAATQLMQAVGAPQWAHMDEPPPLARDGLSVALAGTEATQPARPCEWQQFTAADGLAVHYRQWLPDGAPRALVQVVHGAAEHSGRYQRFATALTAQGYAVYATDHRGHGRTRLRSGALGDAGPDGWNGMVGDEISLCERLRAAHPGLKLALFGHSLGSFIAQDFAQRRGELLDALVLGGTAYRAAPPPAALEKLDAVAAADPLGASQAWSSRFKEYNQPFGGDTGFEWLSRDAAEVRKYLSDPHAGHTFNNELARDIFTGFARMRDAAQEARMPKTLPVLMIQGEDDPIGERLQATQALLAHYQALGLRVDHRFYAGARHELLNETHREQVTRDVLGWLSARLA